MSVVLGGTETASKPVSETVQVPAMGPFISACRLKAERLNRMEARRSPKPVLKPRGKERKMTALPMKGIAIAVSLERTSPDIILPLVLSL